MIFINDNMQFLQTNDCCFEEMKFVLAVKITDFHGNNEN